MTEYGKFLINSFPVDLRLRLKVYCVGSGVTMSSVVEEAVLRFLEEEVPGDIERN